MRKSETEDNRKKIEIEEQNERNEKLTRDLEDTNDELRAVHKKSSEEKQSLLDEKDTLNQKNRSLGTKVMDLERSLQKAKDNVRKVQEEYDDEVKRLKSELEKREKYVEEMNQAKIAFESQKRKDLTDMMEEMATLREENRELSKHGTEFKANVQALEEKAKLYERRYYELEKNNDERMKGYEEQIYSLTQELKIKSRELTKITNENESMYVKLVRAENNEKNALEQLTEINKAYAESTTKYIALEEKNANLRAELIRVAKERNTAEDTAHKKKLKAKILAERIKTLEGNLVGKSKECNSRNNANIK